MQAYPVRHAALSAAAAAVFALALGACGHGKQDDVGEKPRPVTYANPVDLDYRFALADHSHAHGRSAREAADPTLVAHDGTYWLFASKVGGYWRSDDLLHWKRIEAASYPAEEYAPTVAVVNGKWLLATSNGKALYVSDDPATGTWKKIRELPEWADPMIFQDSDGRVYMYAGSSPDQPIIGVELDRQDNFKPIGRPAALIPALDPVRHGWETFLPLGTDEQIRSAPEVPWMEAPWMTKHNGTYYLQYAAPGTQLPTYADGVYTSNSPLGPFRYQSNSPISARTTGFLTSAGHSSTAEGPGGSMWRMTTTLVGVRFGFERRLGLYPTGFLPNSSGPDLMVTNTYLGDYPQLAPGTAKAPLADNLAGWMLLTLRKPAKASSTLNGKFSVSKAFDEDIRTWWAASTGRPGEWLQVDMGKLMRIEAVQVNFADEGSTAHGRVNDAYRYMLEVSDDGRSWKPLLDRTKSRRDAPHDYAQLPAPVKGRFVRITNHHTPAGAIFSVSGLRVFGSAEGLPPAPVAMPKVARAKSGRVAEISWSPSKGAQFYIVRYGVRPGALMQNVQVYDGVKSSIPGLNAGTAYYFTVDAVNESGVARGDKVARD